MFKVGDTVKVIRKTMYCGKETELIPIGTICEVTAINHPDVKENTVEIVPKDGERYSFWYLENEVKKVQFVNMYDLIERFEDMAERGRLLTGDTIPQEDLLNQIVGTIIKVALEIN